MNLTKYNITTLLIKAENALADYASCKNALKFIPDSSVLGYFSVKATASFKAKMYERYKAEIFNRKEITNHDRVTLQQLEKKYEYRNIEDAE